MQQESKAVAAEVKKNVDKIYALKLCNDKYYIGRSHDPEKHFHNHVGGKGGVWTSAHEPLHLLEVREMKSDFDEDSVTLEYMRTYGIDNVRGGSYATVDLSAEDKRTLQRKIDTANKACFICHQRGHFTGKCPQHVCFRCKKYGHWARDCYSRTDIDGNIL